MDIEKVVSYKGISLFKKGNSEFFIHIQLESNISITIFYNNYCEAKEAMLNSCREKMIFKKISSWIERITGKSMNRLINYNLMRISRRML